MIKKNILVIEDKKEIIDVLEKMFENEKSEYDIVFSFSDSDSINEAMKNVHDVVLINSDNAIQIYSQITEGMESFMSPTICISSASYKNVIIDVLKSGINQYMVKPIDVEYLYYTIKNYIRLIYNNKTVSPLTGLPGNIQIDNELKKNIIKKDEFAVLYFDLDNFKAYNDTYGFLKGDDVIRFTATTILDIMRQYANENDFVGHIGGDDFVAITTSRAIDKICIEIINTFDKGILNLLSKTDKERGFFEVPNRKGIIEQYPLTSISIGVVIVDKNQKIDRLEIGEIGAQVKHKAKTIHGSAYVINKRMM